MQNVANEISLETTNQILNKYHPNARVATKADRKLSAVLQMRNVAVKIQKLMTKSEFYHFYHTWPLIIDGWLMWISQKHVKDAKGIQVDIGVWSSMALEDSNATHVGFQQARELPQLDRPTVTALRETEWNNVL